MRKGTGRSSPAAIPRLLSPDTGRAEPRQADPKRGEQGGREGVAPHRVRQVCGEPGTVYRCDIGPEGREHDVRLRLRHDNGRWDVGGTGHPATARTT